MILITRPKDQAINLYEKLSAQGFRCHIESLSQIKLIKQKVFQKFQVNLELEVRLLGFENDLIEEISCYA